MSLSDMFFACGVCVYVFEWQIYFDEFFCGNLAFCDGLFFIRLL